MKVRVSMIRRRLGCAGLALTLALCGCGEDDPTAMLASARSRLAANDLNGAIVHAKNALQRNPDLAEARYLLGAALLQGGDAASAEVELRRAVAVSQPLDMAVAALAQALLMQGQHQRLIAEFADSAPGQPDAQAKLQTSLAVAHGLVGDAESSQAALNAALAADPNYAPALLLQARGMAAQRDLDGALAVLDTVIAHNPTNPEAWQLKAELLRARDRQGDAALAAYRKVLALEPRHLLAHAGVLSMLLARNNLDDAAAQLQKLQEWAPNQVQTRYFETLLALQRKDLDQAVEAAKRLLALAPTDVRSLQLAGKVALQANDLVQARRYLEQAVQASPQAGTARRLLVTTYLRAGMDAKALAALQPALQDEAPDAATSVLAGDVYRRAGDIKKAQAYFARAAKLEPGNARAMTSLALAQMADGKGDDAFEALQAASASGRDITADLALIVAYTLGRNFAAALNAIDVLEKKLPGKPQAAGLRGRTLQLQNDLAGARKSYERALGFDASYYPALDGLAALDLAEKKPEAARQRFEAVLAKDPKNVHALLALARLRAGAGAPQREVGDLLERAVAANPAGSQPQLMLVQFRLLHKDLQGALSAAQSGVTANPWNPMLIDALGRVQQASDDLQQAIVSYTKVAALQPQSPLPHLRLAQAHLASNNPAAAIASLRRALTIQPDLLQAQTQMVALALSGQDFPAALAVARTVRKQRPQQAAGYLLEAEVALLQKRPDIAAAVLRSGIEATPAPELAKKLHATLAAGKRAEADRFAASWLKKYPHDVAFRLHLGDIATASQDYVGAEQMYTSVTRIDPTHAIAFNNLAWVGAKLNRGGTVALAEKALALAPDYAEAMDTLAMLLSAQNDYVKALAWEDKALALQPQNGHLKLNLAKIHLRGGRKDLARKALDQLAALGDRFPAHAEVAQLRGGP